MYNNKERCKTCKYGWQPPNKFLPYPMCLYYHDTGKTRIGDDETCNSYEKLTKEEIKLRQRETSRTFKESKRYKYGQCGIYY